MRGWATSAVVVGAVLAACMRPPAAEPMRHLVIGQSTSAVTLDPHGHDQAPTFNTLSQFYETLVRFGPEMDLRPSLAERWENPSDTVWRFHLRSGVLFHDGRKFGAADVVRSLERAMRPASHVAYYLQSVEDVKALDETTVEITTRRPTPVLLNKLVFIAMVPRDTSDAEVARPIGTGPYSFVGGRASGPIAGERFERYWGTAPAFQRVTVLPLPDPRERAEAVRSGRADLVSQFPSQYWSDARRSESVRMVSRVGTLGIFLGFSLTEGPFVDRRVREAVAAAVDRDRLVERGLQGLGAPLSQFVPPVIVGFVAGLEAPAHDPARARRLLAEAGHPNGLDTPLYVNVLHADIAEEVVRELGAVGVRVKLEVLAQKDFYDRWSSEALPLSLFGWSPTTGDASGTFEPLLHSFAEGYGGFNRVGYKNPDLDRLIEESDEVSRTADRLDMLFNAGRIAIDDLPILPLVLRNDLYAVRRDLDWSPRLDRRVLGYEVRPAASPAPSD